jgi:hypothetical protein
MGRESFNRRTANVLRKTIQQLEADPTVDTQDPAFVNLKCTLLNRILQAEAGMAHVESRIHLVKRQVSDQGASEEGAEFAEEDSDSAIA